MTSLSIPGAAILTLAAGGIFGALAGTIIVSFASTLGATIAFLISRFLLGDYLQKKYNNKLAKINHNLQENGNFYILTLRLIPIFPFFVINTILGLTKIKLRNFYIFSQIGMLPGTFIFVYAGSNLANINSLSEILSKELFISFALLGLFPLCAKKIINFIKRKKYDYNLIVIGAGAGGLVSSYIASAVKAKVALIEKHKMGGDCLNYGCVPSKALIKSAKILKDIKNAEEFGFNKLDPKVDFAKIIQRVQEQN